VRMGVGPGAVSRIMRRRRSAPRAAGLQIRAGCWAIVIAMIGAFGVACNDGTLPPRSPAPEEASSVGSPYPTTRLTEPVDAPSDIEDVRVNPGPASNSEQSSGNASPGISVVEEEVVIPTVVPPGLPTDSMRAAGDPCGMPGNDCGGVAGDNSVGEESDTNTPGILATSEVGNGEEGNVSGGDTRAENADPTTSPADASTTSPSPG
jgi:hypothetical protein